MRINFHGGQCCGIKTIKGFDARPSAKYNSFYSTPRASAPVNKDKFGEHVSSSNNAYAGPGIPVDGSVTLEEVFDKHLDYIKDWRPYGVVEVVINDNQKVMGWESVFLARGFRLVTDCYNSNSGQRIWIYHLAIDKEETKVQEKAQVPLRANAGV